MQLFSVTMKTTIKVKKNLNTFSHQQNCTQHCSGQKHTFSPHLIYQRKMQEENTTVRNVLSVLALLWGLLAESKTAKYLIKGNQCELMVARCEIFWRHLVVGEINYFHF